VIRYLTAATLARAADAGAIVGLVLLALSAGPGLDRPGLVGGVLAACLTAPHLIGPVVARHLDRARDGRPLLAGAFVLYGAAIGAATLTFGRVPIVLTGVLVVVAGLCGPLLTGGLSSRLAGLVPGDERSQRRAQGADAVTYGIGGSAGPAAVAALAAATGATGAMLVLAAAAALGGLVVLTLPRSPGSPDGQTTAMTVPAVLRLMVVSGPLRRLTYATVLVAVATGSVSVLAVVLGEHLRGSAVPGATLAAAFGAGNLLGSLGVTAFPSTGDVEHLITRYAAVVGVAFGVCAVVPGFAPAVAAFGALGAVNAPFFTATLAARSEFAPPDARAQIFVSSAGLKVAAASAGTAVAGALVGSVSPRLLLFAAGGLVVLTALVTAVDRERGGQLGGGVAAGPDVER
jgi:hypothetical protein